MIILFCPTTIFHTIILDSFCLHVELLHAQKNWNFIFTRVTKRLVAHSFCVQYLSGSSCSGTCNSALLLFSAKDPAPSHTFLLPGTLSKGYGQAWAVTPLPVLLAEDGHLGSLATPKTRCTSRRQISFHSLHQCLL